MKTWFAEEMFVLFGILALGAALGRLSVRNISLGSAGVLVAALVAGWFGLHVPREVMDLGLVLFVYSVGLQAGPSFLRTFRLRAIQWALVGGLTAVVGAVAVFGAARAFHVPFDLAVGLYTGALTCTPALAGAVDALGRAGLEGSDAPVGYGIAYPFSMLGVVVLVSLLPRLLRKDLGAVEAAWQAEQERDAPRLQVRVFRITNPNCAGLTVAELARKRFGHAVLSRVRRGDAVFVATADVRLELSDHVMAVGTPEEMEKLQVLLGVEDPVPMDLNPSITAVDTDMSEPSVAGRTLGDLHAWRGHGVVVTRIRRAGVEIAPDGRTPLEMGDHLHIVGYKEATERFAAWVGGTRQHAEETSMVPFLVGLVLGVTLGLVPVPLPNGMVIQLGPSGGAFLVSLMVGHFRRIGPLRLHVPPAAQNLSRELGLMLFLAGVGTLAGSRIAPVLAERGPSLLILGAGVTLVAVAANLLVSVALFRMNVLSAMGSLSASMTNPPALGAALARSRTQMAALAYASVYPVALIFKILVAQVLVEVLKP